jgi:hypothetical protein
MKYYTALLSKDGIKLKPETDLSNLDRVIDRTGGEFSLTFKVDETLGILKILETAINLFRDGMLDPMFIVKDGLAKEITERCRRALEDPSNELLDQIIDRVDAHFKAPTTNVDCDDQRSEVTPL